MSKNKMKVAAMAVLCGSVLQFGGCFGFGGGNNFFGRIVTATVAGVVSDFLTDNDGVFDLFQD